MARHYHHKREKSENTAIGIHVRGLQTTQYESISLHCNRTSQRDMRHCKLKLVKIGLFSLLLLLLSSIFVIFVSLSASYSLPLTFEVDSLSVHPFNISSSHLTANWNITFSVSEVNSKDNIAYYCEDVNVSVLYKEENISSATIRPFLKKGREKKIFVQADISAVSEYIDGSIADSVFADWRKGTVGFTVEVDARLRSFDPDERRELRKLMMTASCEKVMVAFSHYTVNATAGIMYSDPIQCSTRIVS